MCGHEDLVGRSDNRLTYMKMGKKKRMMDKAMEMRVKRLRKLTDVKAQKKKMPQLT